MLWRQGVLQVWKFTKGLRTSAANSGTMIWRFILPLQSFIHDFFGKSWQFNNPRRFI